MQKKKKSEEESAELRHGSLLEKRNELNAQAREFAGTRDTLNDERRDLAEDINILRDERDAYTKDMKLHKKARNQYQKRAKELIEAKKGKRKDIYPGLGKDLEVLKADLKMMELKQQTVPLSLPEENELLDTLKEKTKELSRLEKVLAEQESIISEVKDVDESITELFRMADIEHEMVVKLSDQAQEVHDRITLMIKSISHLISEANKNHESFVKLKERADAYHLKAKEMREKLMAIRNVRRDEIREGRRLIKDQNRAAREMLYDKKKLDKAADSALERLFKKGKVEIK